MEREPGPLETEVHALIRSKGLASPAVIEAQVTGEMPSLDTRVLAAERMDFVLMEAILRVAREIDDLRSGT